MQPFLRLILTVLLAHLLGDFSFQTSKMMQGKSQGSRAYVVHGGVHFLLLTLCIAVFGSLELLGSLRYWIIAGLYIAVHLGIDRMKQGLVSAKELSDSAYVLVGIRSFTDSQSLDWCRLSFGRAGRALRGSLPGRPQRGEGP